jgi:hypothetical protein
VRRQAEADEIKRLGVATKANLRAHLQQREPTGRWRSSLFQPADKRRHVWAFDPNVAAPHAEQKTH